VIGRLIVPPHRGVVFYCTGRRTHDPFILGDVGLEGDAGWTPAPRPAPAFEYRCRKCPRSWRMGAQQFRALGEAVASGTLTGEVDISVRWPLIALLGKDGPR
jgi:hypothetical protein